VDGKPLRLSSAEAAKAQAEHLYACFGRPLLCLSALRPPAAEWQGAELVFLVRWCRATVLAERINGLNAQLTAQKNLVDPKLVAQAREEAAQMQHRVSLLQQNLVVAQAQMAAVERRATVAEETAELLDTQLRKAQEAHASQEQVLQQELQQAHAESIRKHQGLETALRQ
jgi:hypothetical protein